MTKVAIQSSDYMEHVGLDWRNIPAIGCHLSNNLKQFQLSFKIERIWKTFKCLSNVFNYFQHKKTLKDYKRLSNIFRMFSIIFNIERLWKTLTDFQRSFKLFQLSFILHRHWKCLRKFESLSRSFKSFQCLSYLKDIDITWNTFKLFQSVSNFKAIERVLKELDIISMYFNTLSKIFCIWKIIERVWKTNIHNIIWKTIYTIERVTSFNTLSILFQCSTGTL